MSTSLPNETEYNQLWRQLQQGFAPLDSHYEAGRVRGGPAIATTDGAGRRIELYLLRPTRGFCRATVVVDGKQVAEVGSPDELTEPVLRSVVATLAERLRSEAERVVQEREAERLRRREALAQSQAEDARRAVRPPPGDGDSRD